MTVLAAVLALLVGMTLGMLGGGGAILTVPILVYVLGVSPKSAVPLSLVVVGLSTGIGAVGHWRAGRLRLRDGLRFAAFTMIGAFVGARVGALLSDQVHLLIFGAVVLVAAAAMWWSADHTPTPGSAESELKVALAGVGVGLITGIVGIGGGFLFVPALVALLRYSLARATAVSLLVISLNAAAALMGYGPRLSIPWAIAIPFVVFAVAGLVLGTRLAPRVPTGLLKRAFSVLLLGVGIFVLYQNLN